MEIKCAVQKYAWGKPGNVSLVAALAGENNADEPYAELWMGTHPSGPCTVKGERLSDRLARHPEWLGQVEAYENGGGLPFLFKVLSVAKALSIQAHPDRTLAKRLHAEKPDMYKDDNHKPEMAIALTPFQAMCGFRSPDTIVGFIDAHAEFAELVGADAADALRKVRDDDGARAALRGLLRAVLQIPPNAPKLEALVKRLGDAAKGAEAVVVQCAQDFPGDAGALAPFFLHVLELEPGEAIFLAANEPHAYLRGDLLECMACSDNVVRAGLTPKAIDKEVLVEMLTYNYGYPKLYRPTDGPSTLYQPPVPDFEVETFRVGAGQWHCPVSKSPQIALLVEGETDAHDRGACFFIPAGEKLTLPSPGSLHVAVARAQLARPSPLDTAAAELVTEAALRGAKF